MEKGKLTIGRSVLYGELGYPRRDGEDRFHSGRECFYGTIDFIVEGGPAITLDWDDGGCYWRFEPDA